MKVENDVVRNEVVKELSQKYNRGKNFVEVLTKICLDFKINNYKDVIKNFLKE